MRRTGAVVSPSYSQLAIEQPCLLSILKSTYRAEDFLAVKEIQRAKDQSRLGCLVALNPALCQQVPFGLELAAQLTVESRINSSEENSDTVVSRRRC